jgi:hypothetical protein
VYPSGLWRFYAQALLNVYSTPIQTQSMDPTGPGLLGTTIGQAFFVDKTTPLPSALSGGASLGGQMRSPNFRLAFNGTFQTGWNGTQVWLDLNGGYVPQQSRVSVEGRISAAYVNDAIGPVSKGGYLGGQIWGSWLLTRSARVSLVFELNHGPASVADTKLFVMYDLKAVL